MSEWNHTVCMLYVGDPVVANKIARSFDPDTGGDRTFALNASTTGLEPATHCVVDTSAKDIFIGYLSQMTDPHILEAFVDQDYAARWPDLEPPSLNECVEFLSLVEWAVDASLEDFLAANSLKLVIKEMLEL